MSTVKDALARKSGELVYVRSSDMVIEVLHQMRDNRVRSVLVIDDGVLAGIVTQGDCAIRVLLPGLDAKQTSVGQVMTGNPVTVKLNDQVQGCMALMSARGCKRLSSHRRATLGRATRGAHRGPAAHIDVLRAPLLACHGYVRNNAIAVERTGGQS